MSATIDPTADADPLKRPVARERRAVRGFQIPTVREIAQVAHGAADGASGRHQAQHTLDRR
jgi:hypothetical protein